jgi:carbonic anhydrase
MLMTRKSTAAAPPAHAAPSRRGLLHATVAGAAALAGLGTGGVSPRQARAQGVVAEPAAVGVTPDRALAILKNGNARYVAGNMTSFNVDLDEIRKHTQNKQTPFAAVLSCADSRVPVEIVFDQSIGRLFVSRVAGNITTPEIIASLEYGAAVLGISAILVLGHGDCGAVKATIKGEPEPGQITALFPHIRPALDQAGPHLEAATRANARIQAGLLREASPLLAERIAGGLLKIASGYYSVVTGAVTFDS